MLKDNIKFVEADSLPDLMNIFGWTVKEGYMIHEGLAVVRADFYPLGHMLAYSSKAQIICDGEMCIKYNGQTFTDYQQLVEIYGTEAINTFPEWEIKIEKQWTVKRNGQWVSAFTNLAEMPYRKSVRC